MKLLIYTRTINERKQLGDVFYHQGDLPVFIVDTAKEFEAAIKWFKDMDDGVLILPIQSASTGWRAPPDTIVLFTGSIPDGPAKLQAMARVTPGVINE